MLDNSRLGMIGFGIAAGVTLSTLWVFIAVWKGWAVNRRSIKPTASTPRGKGIGLWFKTYCKPCFRC